jgi:hypothetical protein
MRLPNATSAFLDIRKIANYCLDGDHPLGRHKARVFRAALGFIEALPDKFYIVEFLEADGRTRSLETLPIEDLSVR